MNDPIAGAGTIFPDLVFEQAQCLFMSSHCSIRTKGTFERIELPVNPFIHRSNTAEAIKGEERFHKALLEAMNRARAFGIANPIVIGAIPFDVSQPSYLTIPRSYEIFSRELEGGTLDSEEGVPFQPDVLGLHSVPGDHRFKQGVQQAIANFQLSDIRKTVLSRILEVNLSEPVNTDTIFARLVAQNPSAYHFRLPLGAGAELIGASPELLLRKQGNKVYSYPLAGSAKRQPDPELDRTSGESLLQSHKDAYEHRLVIDDIREQLAPLCTALKVPESPSLISTRAMWHLATDIQGELADPTMTALQVACRLHPTPAVCGFPTRQARKLINLVESFERDVFTGMVGWCDAEGNGEWVVTIRCGIIEQNRIRLFAGAGIVEASCPESEWAETQAKLQTMLNALGIDINQFHSASNKQDGAPTQQDTTDVSKSMDVLEVAEE